MKRIDRINLTQSSDLQVFSCPRADGSSIDVYLCLPRGLTESTRPTIVFLHGSGADSVFARRGEQPFYPLFFGSLEVISGEWNVCFIEKRGVKLSDFAGADGFRGCSQEYVDHATRDNRISDAVRVIDGLVEDGLHRHGDELLVIGCSEGSDIAAGVAVRSKHVRHVGLFPFSAGHGLHDCLVGLRGELARGEIGEAKFHEQYDWLVGNFRKIRDDPDAVDREFWGHAYRRWASYCFGAGMADLLRVEVPVFMGIPSLDQPESGDWVVAEFIRAGKTNLMHRNYIGYDHGFFEHIGTESVCRHAEVFADLMAWVREA